MAEYIQSFDDPLVFKKIVLGASVSPTIQNVFFEYDKMGTHIPITRGLLDETINTAKCQ